MAIRCWSCFAVTILVLFRPSVTNEEWIWIRYPPFSSLEDHNSLNEKTVKLKNTDKFMVKLAPMFLGANQLESAAFFF